jgi:hypothetical protein
LLKARVLDLAMIVLSRSKKAAVRAWDAFFDADCSEADGSAVGSKTVTDPA